jgi:hypothetical protein
MAGQTSINLYGVGADEIIRGLCVEEGCNGEENAFNICVKKKNAATQFRLVAFCFLPIFK